jgi:hypothetical protein
VIAELDAENARLHGELIDVQCELATARHGYTQMWNRLHLWRRASRWQRGLGGLAAAGS